MEQNKDQIILSAGRQTYGDYSQPRKTYVDYDGYKKVFKSLFLWGGITFAAMVGVQFLPHNSLVELAAGVPMVLALLCYIIHSSRTEISTLKSQLDESEKLLADYMMKDEK